MVINDNVLSGNHYIGTNFSGMMAGPVSITGLLSIDVIMLWSNKYLKKSLTDGYPDKRAK